MVLELNVIGYIGKDVVVKEVNGKKVAEFSIAHSEAYKNKEGLRVEKTTWVSCAYWTGEAVWPYLKKGTMVRLMGTPSVQAYVKKDGQLASDLRMSVITCKLLAKPAVNAGTGGPVATMGAIPPAAAASPEPAPEGFIPEPVGDDLPF